MGTQRQHTSQPEYRPGPNASAFGQGCKADKLRVGRHTIAAAGRRHYRLQRWRWMPSVSRCIVRKPNTWPGLDKSAQRRRPHATSDPDDRRTVRKGATDCPPNPHSALRVFTSPPPGVQRRNNLRRRRALALGSHRLRAYVRCWRWNPTSFARPQRLTQHLCGSVRPQSPIRPSAQGGDPDFVRGEQSCRLGQHYQAVWVGAWLSRDGR